MNPDWFEWFIKLLTNKWKEKNQINLTFSNKQKSLSEDIEKKTIERLGPKVKITKIPDFPIRGHTSLCFNYEA
jgi:hypothetical protein